MSSNDTKKSSKMMTRREAREIAFKLIFEYGFNRTEKMDMIEEYTAEYTQEAKHDSVAYISEVYAGACSHYDELVEIISANSEGFAFDRLFKVDTALLVLALYEIKYMDSIPYKVSVDEALNLAEKYSTEKSSKYINGILSKFSK